jgi:tryptophan halogenase
MKNKLENVVVVGGGTAGWLTALFLKKQLPFSIITVVESPEIGILGAGEGSTPQLISFLDELGIPVSDLVKETHATIKNGIKFTNWNGDNKHYYHGFSIRHQKISGMGAFDLLNDLHLTTMMSISEDTSFEDFNYTSKICELNRVPHVYRDTVNPELNAIFKFEQIADFSIHFNAVEFAAYLKKIAISRGIVHLEDTVTEVKSNSNNDISSLVLKSGREVRVNFVFDCSGFKRLLIGTHFDSKWTSYKDFLPVNAAVPFFIPINEHEEIPSYTESISMKYGWMWKIPLQNRFGCGYVYDSSLISEQEAIKEIESYLGFEPDYPRKDKGGFSFSAGYYDTTWVNNCIAIGLSSGFIEPLEATSIFSSIFSLRRALFDISALIERDSTRIDLFNKEVLEFNESIFNFVYFHYLGDRNDTLFWNNFKIKSHPNYIKDVLKIFEVYVPRNRDFPITTANPFSLPSWNSVGHGLNKLNIDMVKRIVADNLYYEYYGNSFNDWKVNVASVVSNSVIHREFLEKLKK